MKKIRISNTIENIGAVIKVFKSDFEIFEFSSGYYAIVLKNTHGGGVVWGGDSACEDHHDKAMAQIILKNWDGTPHYPMKNGFFYFLAWIR